MGILRHLVRLARVPLFALNWTSVALFYMLALTKFIRYSDFVGDLRGMNAAVVSMHQYVLPFVNLESIQHAYGTPIALSTLNLSDTGASVRMRLSANTTALNHPTTAGSATFYSNWAMTTLNLTSTTQLPAICAQARASATGKYEQFNTSTIVLHKPNVDGGQLNLWAGVKHLPTTIKATTQVVTLTVHANNNPLAPTTSGCLYRMKLYHAEAFELWNRDMATFNILQADFQINDTNAMENATGDTSDTSKKLVWTFDPRVSRLNWFFYRRPCSYLNVLSLISQLVGFALLFASGRRIINLKPKQTSIQSSDSRVSSGKILSYDESEMKPMVHHEVDPNTSQGLYYSSCIINVAEILIILNDRYMIFRCINALDFFMTAGWGFNRTNMWIEYINIMGSIFWLVLGLHKCLSLGLFASISLMFRCLKYMKASRRRFTPMVRRRSTAYATKLASDDRTAGRTCRQLTMSRKITKPLLVMIKEATRPRPDLIVLLMMLFPKFFYAHFFGGATAWTTIDLPTTISLASNLGANLLIANTLYCGLLIFPLNALFVLVAPRHVLDNGWIQLRKPGRVYYQCMTFCGLDRKVLAFDEGKIHSLLLLAYFQLVDLWMRCVTKQELPDRLLELCMSLRFHDIINDSISGELQAFYSTSRAEDCETAYMRYVEHVACPSPFRSYPVVVIAEYANRGMLLTWPGVSSGICGVSNMDFTRMFLGRIHLIGAAHDSDFAPVQLLLE